MDLCIIFSNPPDNVIEACLNIPNSSIITIDMKFQQGYQYIAIRKTYIQNTNMTTKQGKTQRVAIEVGSNGYIVGANPNSNFKP